MSAPILSAFDWEMHTGETRHLRAGFKEGSADGKLQYRYVNSIGEVEWRDLMTSLTSVRFNFADYWDNSAFQSRLLFVNGLSYIYNWTGGITTFASATGTTITKEGTETWAELGFSATGSVVIEGATYAYTGGTGTTTLTGVTPDPSGSGYTAGMVIHQAVVSTPNSSATGLPSTLANSLIGNLKNQIYIGSLVNNQVYVSKVNNYLDYSFTSPVRVVGEGAILTLDGTPVAFVPQESEMYISAGKDQWYITEFKLSSDNAKESLTVSRLKTTAAQAAQSQAFTTKIRNNIVFVSNEPVVSSLGRVDNVVLTPQISDLSFPIINDMTSYDFTDGCVFYWRNFMLMAIPQNSVIRIYNMTKGGPSADVNIPNFYWEAPLSIAFSRFSIIDGELYGHSYLTSETFKMFEGYNFNGHPIDARAIFSYMNFGNVANSKSFNEFFAEGYISTNATINLQIDYELDGYAGTGVFPIVGTDAQIVQLVQSNAPLGKVPLGKNPLGGSLEESGEPNKFRVIKTFPQTPFYEFSPSFRSVGTDYNWSILRFGPAAFPTSEGNNPIKQ